MEDRLGQNLGSLGANSSVSLGEKFKPNFQPFSHFLTTSVLSLGHVYSQAERGTSLLKEKESFHLSEDKESCDDSRKEVNELKLLKTIAVS